MQVSGDPRLYLPTANSARASRNNSATPGLPLSAALRLRGVEVNMFQPEAPTSRTTAPTSRTTASDATTRNQNDNKTSSREHQQHGAKAPAPFTERKTAKARDAHKKSPVKTTMEGSCATAGAPLADSTVMCTQILLLETCSAYLTLCGMRTSSDEPITGEVSGLYIRIDKDVVQRLVHMELPPRSQPSNSEAQRERADAFSSSATHAQNYLKQQHTSKTNPASQVSKGTPIAVRLHLQNFKVFMSAPFDDKYASDSEPRYCEVSWEVVRGMVQMRKSTRMYVTMELDNTSMGQSACMSLRYSEWKTGNKECVYLKNVHTRLTKPGADSKRSAGEFVLQGYATQPNLTHTFFCVHRVALDFRSEGEALGEDTIVSHTAPRSVCLCLSVCLYCTCMCLLLCVPV
jgi:hypothetical protein